MKSLQTNRLEQLYSATCASSFQQKHLIALLCNIESEEEGLSLQFGIMVVKNTNVANLFYAVIYPQLLKVFKVRTSTSVTWQNRRHLSFLEKREDGVAIERMAARNFNVVTNLNRLLSDRVVKELKVISAIQFLAITVKRLYRDEG
ncbi:uncharacterized protein LOC144436451 [Glandiceps talaboti]